MIKEDFCQIGFAENQILQKRNQFSSEIPHALQNIKILCEKPVWFFKEHTGFSKYQKDQKISRVNAVICLPYALHRFQCGVFGLL